MPDLTDELAAVLRARADDAPAAPAISPHVVRAVRRRQVARLAALSTAVVVVTAGAVATGAALRPAQRAAVTPVTQPPAPLTDDKYEFCPKTGAVTLVEVATYGTELKFNKGCFLAAAGVPVRLSFTNYTAVRHDVVVAPDGGEPFAKTETVYAGGGVRAGYDTIDLGTLTAGDYTLTCTYHQQMHAQLVVR